MKKFFIESWRAKKSKPLSFVINWLGLTLGFAVVIVMFLVIVSERKHDNNYTAPMKEVYAIGVEEDMKEIIPGPYVEFLRGKVTGIEAVTSVFLREYIAETVDLPDQQVRNVYHTIVSDSSFLDVFPLRMVAGGGPGGFGRPDQLLINEKTAVQMFGTVDVIGRPLRVGNQHALSISGVYEDLGEHAIWNPAMVLPQATVIGKLENWGSWGSSAFIRLNPQSDPAEVRKLVNEETLAHFRTAYAGWDIDNKIEAVFYAFPDLYFATNLYQFGKVDPDKVKVLTILAILVLLIAIVNYVNIYTARSTDVMRTMAIRRIMGADRSGLVSFVIADSIWVSFLAAVTAYILAYALRSFYLPWLGLNLSMTLDWFSGTVIFIGLPLVCGVLSGIFPALSLTRTRPIDAMANRSSGGRQMGSVRNALIVVQFVISISLIASTLLINKQMRYIASFDTGYNRENVVVTNGMNVVPKFETFRAELLQNPQIINASVVQGNPMNVNSIRSVWFTEGQTEDITVDTYQIDEHAFGLFGFQMLEGDSISAANVRSLNGGQMLVNESFVKLMRQYNPDRPFPDQTYIGMFRDYQHKPLAEGSRPLALTSINGYGTYGDIYIKVTGQDMDATLKYIADTYAGIYPDEVYDFSFMDANYEKLYQREQHFRAQLTVFSLLAVFIGCLGLFALVGYSVEKRRKEIAVRKVHGATILEVIAMLCVSFVRWLAISFVIAVPLVWYFMDDWIRQYAYRTTLSWWIFGLAGVATLLIALMTVFGQSYKAATANPAESLKAE